MNSQIQTSIPSASISGTSIPIASSRAYPPAGRGGQVHRAHRPEPVISPAASRDDRLHRELLAKVTREGCFRPAPLRVIVFAGFIVALYVTGYLLLLNAPDIVTRALAIVALAFVNVQAGFLGHEAGHGAITRHRRLGACIGQAAHTLLNGFAYSYFLHIHRVHHPYCNDRARDPDMQSEAFSMYRQSAASKVGAGRLVSRYQAVLIWILIGLQGFTLKVDGLRYVLQNRSTTRADQTFLIIHLVLWGAIPAVALGPVEAAINYTFITVLIGYYVGAVFVVNHVGTKVIEPDDPISHLAREIGVTRDLGTSRLSHFLLGGVNNHIEHHLFPSMPTARLPLARQATREFCRRHGIAYREMSWPAAAREVTAHFRAMSKFVPR